MEQHPIHCAVCGNPIDPQHAVCGSSYDMQTHNTEIQAMCMHCHGLDHAERKSLYQCRTQAANKEAAEESTAIIVTPPIADTDPTILEIWIDQIHARGMGIIW